MFAVKIFGRMYKSVQFVIRIAFLIDYALTVLILTKSQVHNIEQKLNSF